MKSPKLIRGHLVYSKDEKHLIARQGGCIYTEDGVIQAVFPTLPEGLEGIPVEDYGEKLLIPGLVDLHVHAPQYAFRGTGMDLELLDWLNTYTYPEESKYERVEYAAKAYGMFTDGLRRGGTTRACIFATTHVPATLELMRQLEESGLRCMVGKVNMDRNTAPEMRETPEASLKSTESWLEQAKAFPNTKPILTPRFVPACSDELLAGLGRVQAKTGLPVQSHLSENPAEVDWVRKLCPTAKGYADAYSRSGLFNEKTVMAHCVYCTPEELDLMAERRVFAAHCPQSNMNLASGIAPAREFLNRGIQTGLGTDVAGGATLSMFRAVTDAIQVSKLRWRLADKELEPLTFPEALYLATAGGGAFFGRVGRLEPGYACDLLVLDDGDLPTPRELSPEERLERFFYLGGDGNVAAKYVAGEKIL